MNRILMLVCVVVLSASTSWAYKTLQNGIEWEYEVSNGKASISDVPIKTAGVVAVPEEINGYPVTSIKSSAFSSCNLITEIKIPGTIKSIGKSAFAFCRSLISVNIPNGVTIIESETFRECESLTMVSLPNSLTEIGEHAFGWCSKLKTISVPSGYIHEWAFASCSALENLELAEGVSGIQDAAFEFCKALKEVVIPSTVHSVGSQSADSTRGVFRRCESLTSVVLKDGVKSIGSYAFAGCENLQSVEIPSSVTEIGDYAFKDCEKIVYVSLGQNIIAEAEPKLSYTSGTVSHFTSFNGSYDYYGVKSGGCRMRMSFELPKFQKVEFKWNVESGSGGALYFYVDGELYRTFYGSSGTAGSSGCSAWSTVSLSLKGGYHTFEWKNSCSGLAYLRFEHIEGARRNNIASIFPDSIKSIQKVKFGCGVTELFSSLFTGCENISSIALPAGVERICDNCLMQCSVLSRIDIPKIEDWQRIYFEDLSEVPEKNGVSIFVGGELLQTTYDGRGLHIVDGWLLDVADRTIDQFVIPEGVVGIGREALADMYELVSVVWPTTLKYIGVGAFRNDTYLDKLDIPDSVEEIGAAAFENCSWMQTMTMGAGVRSVGDRAFAGCTKLAAAKFAEGLGEVGDAAFSNCWRMMSVSLPVSVSNVAAMAFKDCASLTGVAVPTGIAPMSKWFAPVYRQIENVTVPKGTTKVCAEMFAGCAALKTVELPESLEVIGDEAFAGCAALKAIVLPKNVAVLGKRVFSGCAALSDVTLSRALTAIPDGTFAGCEALDSFVVPEAVTELGSQIVPSATTAIYYLGNAPAYAADVYAQANASLVSYVVEGTKGWDGRPASRDIPRNWPTTNARAITTWPPIKIDVTFVGNGGAFENPAGESCVCKQIVDTAYSLPPYEPVRKGYRFDGYWTEANGGTRVTSGVAVKLTKDHSLYAHWKEYDTPTIEGDEGATVTGDAKSGFVVRPSAGNTAVEVTIPQGVDAAKVTVEVTPKVATVKPNGAKVKIVVGENDITGFLVIPESEGVLNIAAATVKEEIVKETLDPSKDAVIELDAANPKLITAPTRKGLFYQLREGVTLGGMKGGDSTIGDGEPWTPEITVKGGNSAFYSIGVGKGE